MRSECSLRYISQWNYMQSCSLFRCVYVSIVWFSAFCFTIQTNITVLNLNFWIVFFERVIQFSYKSGSNPFVHTTTVSLSKTSAVYFTKRRNFTLLHVIYAFVTMRIFELPLSVLIISFLASFWLVILVESRTYDHFTQKPRRTSAKRHSRTRTNGTLYPPIEPFHSGYLKVSEIHTIYYEQCGNKNGIPILYVHGGPGTGIYPNDRRYFDPKAYHIILFDQRGAGKSTPSFSLEDNDTWSLVRDMEKLRKTLGVSRWILFGGSWGSTLCLAYTEKHTNRVLGLILRAIFTLRDEEIQWFLQKGASNIFPEYWEQFVAPIPEDERGNLIAAYYKRLTGDDEEERLRCAQSWCNWEMATSRLKINASDLARSKNNILWALAFARTECHYYINKGFMAPNQILNDAHIIRNAKIPVTIVQGRYDLVCPVNTAWELYKKLPEANLFFIEGAGHSVKEEEIEKKLVETCDKYKTIISEH